MQGHGRRKRMTRDEFVANTRHIAPELSREYLSDMYASTTLTHSLHMIPIGP